MEEQWVDKKVDRMRESWPELDYRKLWEFRQMYNNLDLIDPYGPVLLGFISYPPVVAKYGDVLTQLRDLKSTVDFVRLDADPYKLLVYEWGFRMQPLYRLYNRGIIVWEMTPDQFFPANDPNQGTIMDTPTGQVFLPYATSLRDVLLALLDHY